MIRLDAADKLIIQTSSTSQIDWDLAYEIVSTTDAEPRTGEGSITTATNTDVVATGTELRQVRQIVARNAGAANNTVSISKFVGATTRPLFRATLAPGEMIQYTSNTGFQVLDSAGRLETVQAKQSDRVPPLLTARTPYNKTSAAGQIAATDCSLWKLGNFPAAGVTPTTAANCNSATAGAFPLLTRTGTNKRLLTALIVSGANISTTVYVEDRLAHMGGLNGTLTTAQTVNLDVSVTTDNMQERIGSADFSDVEWYLEWYTATGATSVTPTINCTFADGTTGTANIWAVGAIAMPASVAISRRYKIVPSNGKVIKSVQSVQLSATTATAGNFGVTAIRRYESLSTNISYKEEVLKIPVETAKAIPDSACLTLAVLCSTASSGIVNGSIEQTVVAA